MKTYITGILAVLLSACSANADTTLSFGADFKLTVRQSLMDGATVFSSDELSLKTANNHLISGKLLSVDSEKLPQSFNIQQYPDYLLKRTPLTSLPPETAKLFENSSEEVNYSYDLSALEIHDINSGKLYSLCKETSCLAFVVKPENTDFILTIHTSGMSKTEFTDLIKGGLDAKN
ncbi:hypothetical protein [Rheinheimera aquimaris]|jgi:hypothetical protein|uniref:hypothetical protein n=1 Tax=Rheinheimera aquimaris TaxID=412437 RepID=UPI000E7DE538|nr:hypothetical protein [Rheinheimera aquimaris]MCD1600279.1 hypothetical protein [Rheinheimera aquimaris]HBN90438.1 hypothetical protein [Rheinheimera sp.]|tara:strand:- start:2394 stop:2921 length:528 start_codon:yes stop_codon:yes gene_type:complete